MELTMEIPTAGPETYCRLCLGKDSLLGVFSSNRDDDANNATELVKKIFECTNIKVAYAAAYMQQYCNIGLKVTVTSLSSTVDAGCAICHRCLQAVQDFYHFRVRSNKVNDLIQVTTVVANGDDSGSDAARYSPTPSKQSAPSIKSITSSSPAPVVRKHHHCRYCPKSFRTIAALKEHGNRAHLAGKQHHCPNCLAQFQHAPSLARHVRSRSCFAFSKYRCRVCSESFHEREQWADHIQIHAKDFPYQCPDCWSQFKHKATLRRHANTVHLLVKV